MIDRKKLLLIILLSLCIRLFFWVFVLHHPGRAFDSDSGEYLRLAGTLLEAGTFPSITRTPAYPSFIASVYYLFGKLPQAVLVIQSLLDSATAVIVTLISYRIIQDARYALLAGLLYAMNPFAVFYSNMILSETLFTFILAVATFLFTRFNQSDRKTDMVLSSLLTGVAIFFRPIALYVPFLFAACFFISGQKIRDAMTRSLIFVMVSFTVLAPWYVRNYRDYGRWTLSGISDFNYVVSFAPEVLMLRDDLRSVATTDVNGKIEYYQKALRLKAEERYGRLQDDSSGAGSGLLLVEAKRVVHDNLPLFIGSHLVNIGRVLLPYRPDFRKITGADSTMILFIPFAADLLIMASFAGGVAVFLKRRARRGFDRKALTVMLVLIAYFSFAPGIVGYARFRVPVLPYISVFSALGLAGFAGLRSREDAVR